MTTNTQAPGIGDREIWHPENSTTAQKRENSHWEISYGKTLGSHFHVLIRPVSLTGTGDGSYAFGGVWHDTIQLGNITIGNATIEDAQYVSPSIVYDASLSGIFGLAIDLGSRVSPQEPNMLDRLLPLLSQQVFTADLKYHGNGSYEFGRVDKTKYQGDIHWVKLDDGAEFWQFNFTGFNLGDSNLWFLSQWTAIADTGTTLLLLDPMIVETYYGQTEAAFNDTVGGWTFPCDTDMPPFRLGFDNGYHVTIPGEYIVYAPVEPGSTFCYGGLQSSLGQPFAILGDIFLKACFAVFDVANKHIGFADKDLGIVSD